MGRKKGRLHVVREEEQEQKGFEHLRGSLTPDWWHKADEYQIRYSSAIKFKGVTMVDACAGSGKTTIAVTEALDALRKGQVDIIRYVRFVDERTQSLGFLPGGEEDKEKGFMFPFYEAMAECGVQREAVDALVSAGVIEMATDIHMRGRNMKSTFLILDEAQNGNIVDLRLVLTRPHDDGKTVVIGHAEQCDRPLPKYGREGLIPFQVYMRHMAKKPWTALCTLKKDYRGERSAWADKIMDTVRELEAEEA